MREWLTRHPRFTFHFTPTSCSWANAVEGFFAKLTRRRLKRGVFKSIVDLQTAVNRFITEANTQSKPFVWTKHPDTILAAVKRGRQTLDLSTSPCSRLRRPCEGYWQSKATDQVIAAPSCIGGLLVVPEDRCRQGTTQSEAAHGPCPLHR